MPGSMMPLSDREVVSSNTINSRDHGAFIIVVAVFGMTCFLLFLLIRLAIRWPLGSLSGIDDLVVVVATVSDTTHSLLHGWLTFEVHRYSTSQHSNRCCSRRIRKDDCPSVLYISCQEGRYNTS